MIKITIITFELHMFEMKLKLRYKNHVVIRKGRVILQYINTQHHTAFPTKLSSTERCCSASLQFPFTLVLTPEIHGNTFFPIPPIKGKKEKQ